MSTSSRSKDAQGVEAYFTDVIHLRNHFGDILSAETRSKRILVIHGVGGIGKSSVLRMFRLKCKKESIPVGLASGDQVKSSVDVLADWADDLQTDRVSLPTYAKVNERYRAIQAKVDQEAGRDAATKFGKAAAKTVAETAGSMIPGVGPIAGKLAGVGAEALVDWLRTFLSKPDIDLLLDPTQVMTDAFLSDIGDVSKDRRVVLMLDTYEQLAGLDDWARDVAQRLPGNVLLVIAGRAVPDWSRRWPGWLAEAEVEELKPMTEAVMRELVVKYYQAVRGGTPAPKQVDSIVQFARGLPLVVTTAVQLWVEYGVEDFETVKPQVAADLVDRLKEGVPGELVPALEAAAALRWFNQPLLRAVLGQEDVAKSYNELRRFPFVRPRAEGLALHDTVRDMIDENLRVEDPDRHRELHTRALSFFKARLEHAAGEEVEKLQYEYLYQTVLVDEAEGMQAFQGAAEGLTRYCLVDSLRRLLSDAYTYPLKSERSRLWRRYYSARLMHFQTQFSQAEAEYKVLSEDRHSDAKLKAYALCDLSEFLVRLERLNEPGGAARALKTLEAARSAAVKLDYKLVRLFDHFRVFYDATGKWDEAIAALDQERGFYESAHDMYGVAGSLVSSADVYGLIGDWRRAYDAQSRAAQLLESTSRASSPRTTYWHLYWSGRLAESERLVRDRITAAENAGDTLTAMRAYKDLGLLVGLQGKYAEAQVYFEESMQRYLRRGAEWSGGIAITLGFWGLVLEKQGMLNVAEEKLLKSLQIKQQLQDKLGIPEILDWLGEVYEVKSREASEPSTESHLEQSKSYYQEALCYEWVGRRYLECAARVGLARLAYECHDNVLLPEIFPTAERLAYQYEYNDHLASLRLIQGHVAWDSQVPEWGIGFDAALGYYQQTLIYALRYNRFLLDEVLAGRPQGTPLRPIIPHCLERGDEGRRMLIALRDWWQTGINDVGTPRPDTISPIPEAILLLEGERLAREREPGDGSPQTPVLDRIDKAIQETGTRE